MLFDGIYDKEGTVLLRFLRGILQYVISLFGVSAFYILTISLIALIVADNIYQLIWTVWFIGILSIFYGFLASLLWELIFHLVHFKTLWRGGVFYGLLGATCGIVSIAIVHFNIGEITSQGWIYTFSLVTASMGLLGIGGFIFYVLRRVSYYDR